MLTKQIKKSIVKYKGQFYLADVKMNGMKTHYENNEKQESNSSQKHPTLVEKTKLSNREVKSE